MKPSQEPYGKEDEPVQKPRKGLQAQAGGSVNISEPLFVWILLLMVAVAVRVLLSDSSIVPSGAGSYGFATTYSDFILGFPGIVILPLIVGAVIGAEVGARSSTMRRAIRSGILNGIYAAVIYVIAIIIIYIVIDYATPQVLVVYSIVVQSMAIPVLVLLTTLEVFAVLAYSRRVDS